MQFINDRLRKICIENNLTPDCLEKLLQCENNKKEMIRKRGLKRDLKLILEEEITLRKES
ncbi:MAG: hypothetical protein A2V67_07920 [Deltaproteobacteria bacterium RBG_13_61_14]|nr:MAG: hypothetical protein A2V67_07920 [Deltaproteobacteria bacterium RBG_13_61_14]